MLIHAGKSADEMQQLAFTGRYFWSVGPLPFDTSTFCTCR